MKEVDKASRCAPISEELKEQHPPLACTPGSQQPPLLIMPIIGDSASGDLALRNSLNSDFMMESVKKEVVTGTSCLKKIELG
jgi:hypothetical protein